MKVSKDTHSKLGMPEAEKAISPWDAIVKSTIARFARGNTAAQTSSILLPHEQDSERAEAEAISGVWKKRYDASKAR